MTRPEPISIIDRLAAFSETRAAVALVAGWGFGEAIVIPVVPDVALYLLALGAPRRAALLFGTAAVAALAGTFVLCALATLAPAAVQSTVLSVPGVDRAMLDSARAAVASGDPLAMAQIGPGTPLMVYTVAWVLAGGNPVALAAGALLNRVTRIGPGLLVAMAAGYLAPRWIRRHATLVIAVYAAAWIALYSVYLGIR